MRNHIGQIPEVQGLSFPKALIRIPPELDVPVTPRVRRLIDSEAFRRLSRISQLGLVSLVYPAANHTRFEHSLGVYRTALLYLQRLGGDIRFCETLTEHDAEVFLVGALLHDIGHWPFCHPIEDMRDQRVPRHEELAQECLAGEITQLLDQDWSINPDEINDLLRGKGGSPNVRLMSTLLSGPIDIDKMDYLRRDSLHAGVPLRTELRSSSFDR